MKHMTQFYREFAPTLSHFVSVGHARAVNACMLAVGLSMGSGPSASDVDTSPDTTRILDLIEKSRGKETPAGIKTARDLNADGDRAYKKGNYRQAYTDYYNSYPNFPNAHAYIMTGDVHWRQVVLHAESEARKPAKDRRACSLDNEDFVRRLTMDLAQHHEVGLALAKIENDERFLRSTLYRRARESATCLGAVAKFYDAQPKTACIDIAKLRSCLGAPLIK